MTGGVWHRFNGKSLVWYPKKAWENAGLATPTTWSELVSACETVVDSGNECMTVGGGDGWPLFVGTYGLLGAVFPDQEALVEGLWTGGIKWNGVVLAAPRGREVRAVYHGRVAFADWLAGMGLLVIVDHGEGYMTLYGYNETILKDTGDWVAPGDVIATVGDSGGRNQASLYFELRRGKKPENPRRWVTRRPGS